MEILKIGDSMLKKVSRFWVDKVPEKKKSLLKLDVQWDPPREIEGLEGTIKLHRAVYFFPDTSKFLHRLYGMLLELRD